MWVQQTAQTAQSDVALMAEARALRDETLARLMTAAWRSMANAAARLFHVGASHARTH